MAQVWRSNAPLNPRIHYEGMSTEDIARRAIADYGARQVVGEFSKALRVVRQRSPLVVLELGSAEGGSLYGWCGVAPCAHIITVDVDNHTWKVEQWTGYLQPGQRLTVIQGRTTEQNTYIEVLKALSGAPIDFLFIDASHLYDDVKDDYYAYSKWCAQDAIVMFHDTATCRESLHGVHDFWAEIKEDYPHEEFVEWGQECGIGILYRRGQ